MSKRHKLLLRLRQQPPPRDFRWDELDALMSWLGFQVSCQGGSHFKFHHPVTGRTTVIARPHPGNVLKTYQVKAALQAIAHIETPTDDTSD